MKFKFKIKWNSINPIEFLGIHYSKDDCSFGDIDVDYYFWITLLNFNIELKIERRVP